MRIGIDGRCLQNKKNTGVEEYAKGLILRLLEENKTNQFVVFLNAFGEIKEKFEWLESYRNIKIIRFKIPNKILSLSFLLFGWPKIDKLLGGLDYFISPNFHFGSFSHDCRQILTVHDLSFERMPETFSWKRRLWHFSINPRKKSKEAYKIWAVSNSTAQDLVSLYKIDSKKIVVNYPIFDPSLFQTKLKSGKEIIENYDLPEKFILFLGTIEPRKNIKALINGFEIFKKRNPRLRDYKLVIAGEKGWLWESIIERAQSSDFKKDIIFTNFVNESDKSVIYKLAKVFVYPSFYEGFGFPPLEAMASGTPSIASNNSSMSEVLEDSAILINSYKPAEICIALEILFNDKKVYQDYVEKGLKQAERISNQKRNFSI